jgi:UDP-N-acetylglucosamine 2-epimerase (non-hydrolysing)/UDP-GlcNAc3NAcA epimerase
MLEALGPVLDELAPELVLVYGDTNSTLAGALAGAQARIPVAHVEAGMRSFDRSMPEELNRVLTDHASDLLLCSTETAVRNLAAEGIAEGVHLVGDVMVDVAMAMAPTALQRAEEALSPYGVIPERYLLVTAHRAGNVDDPERLAQLVDLLLALPPPVVFPVHPRTRARLEASGLIDRLESASGVRLAPPVGYLDLLALASLARAVLTDSGGLQKEALLLGVQCITLRDTTEWVETLEGGWNTLVGLDADAALAALDRGRPEGTQPDLYGSGHAAERIRDLLDGAAPHDA